MLYKKLTFLGLGTALLLSCSPLYAGEASCPTLDLKTLPEAICATEKAPFSLPQFSKVTYIAKTPCPSQVGFRKLLQLKFKGAKSYVGNIVRSSPGFFTCTYKLDDVWKKALQSKDDELLLDGILPSIFHVQFLNVPTKGFTCPALEPKLIEPIKQRKKMGFQTTISEGIFLTYTLQTRIYTAAAPGLSPDISKLSPIKATEKAKIVKDFEITCNYTHKTGGNEQTATIVGSSKGNY